MIENLLADFYSTPFSRPSCQRRIKKKKKNTHTQKRKFTFFLVIFEEHHTKRHLFLYFFFLGELKVVSYLSSQDELHSCSVSFIAVFLFPFFIYLLFYLFCFSAILRLCSLHYFFFFCTFLFSLRYPARIRGSQRVLPLALAEKEPKQKTKRKTTTKEANNRSSFAFVSFFFFPAEDGKKKDTCCSCFIFKRCYVVQQKPCVFCLLFVSSSVFFVSPFFFCSLLIYMTNDVSCVFFLAEFSLRVQMTLMGFSDLCKSFAQKTKINGEKKKYQLLRSGFTTIFDIPE